MTDSDERFVDLYERFYKPVYAYCRRRTSAEHVDDAVAETFLIVWRKIDLAPRGSEVLAWMYGVAYRVLGHQWRGLGRRSRLEKKLGSIGHQVTNTPDDVILMRQESLQVLEALSSLKTTDQEILRLAAWEELPQEDIAVVLNISIGAVRQRLYEAKKNLTRKYDYLDNRRKTPAAKKGGVR